MALFYDALTNVDKQVEQILSKLEEEGLAENTIVVFWADHGTGYPRGKIHACDDGLRIPLIMRFPEKKLVQQGSKLCCPTSHGLYREH